MLLALLAVAAGFGCSFELNEVKTSPLECPTGFGSCEPGGATTCETDMRTSSEHCGACGHSCLDGSCTNGQCEPELLGESTGRPYGVALDSEFVYFVDNTGGTINKIDKSGDKDTLVVLASDQEGATFLAADPGTDGSIYFTRMGAGGGVSKVAKTAGSATVLANVDNSWELAIDDDYVYFTAANGLHRVAKTGDTNSLTQLATLSGNPGSVATDADHVYFNDKEAGRVYRLPKRESSASLEILADYQSSPDGIALDNENVYWTCFGTDTVYRRPKQADTERKVLAVGQPQPNGIAAAGEFVYYTSYQGGMVIRVSASGGGPLLLAVCDTPIRVAVDESYVYYTASGQRTTAPGLFKVPK